MCYSAKVARLVSCPSHFDSECGTGWQACGGKPGGETRGGKPGTDRNPSLVSLSQTKGALQCMSQISRVIEWRLSDQQGTDAVIRLRLDLRRTDLVDTTGPRLPWIGVRIADHFNRSF
jgi:hypothetical protein